MMIKIVQSEGKCKMSASRIRFDSCYVIVWFVLNVETVVNDKLKVY